MLNIACAAYGEPPGGGVARQHVIRKVVGEIMELKVCAVAEGRNLPGLQPGDRALFDTGGCADGSTLAHDDLRSDGGQFRAVARSGQSANLRHRAILQYRAGDLRRVQCGSCFVPAAAAALR
jgi:hypothetical protein